MCAFIVFPCLLVESVHRCFGQTVCETTLSCFPNIKKKKKLCYVTHSKLTRPVHTHSILPPTAGLRLNGLSGIILRLIRAQWLCIILELCVTQNQSTAAVICETCCMCPTRLPNVPCDGDSWLLCALIIKEAFPVDFLWGF